MLDYEHSTLVFIKVRYRQNSNFGPPIDSVTQTMQSKLIRTANQYLQQHDQYDDFTCRFYVIGLESDLKCPKITWIKDAFEVYTIMKKITLLSLLVINSLFLSGCLLAIQGASTLSAAITVTNDRRTAGEVLDDRAIAFKLFAWPNTDSELSESHLNFMVYDKTVLITGETPSNALRKYAASQTKAQDAKIKQVFNEITVGPNSGLLNRAKDAAITAQVEALFHNQEVFHPTHIRVMTENQTVYLMGAVTKREADKAVTAAAKAKWVKKVVKLFNYLKTRPAAEVERDRQRELVAQKKFELKKQQAELDAKKSALKQQLRALGGNVESMPY